MRAAKAIAGYFRGGLPYNRSGHGPRPLVVFQVLLFENKPQPGLMVKFVRFYRFLEEEYTVYEVLRRPGMPRGYTMEDLADDYARMVREEFGEPVDVIGVSTGGSIAQHFAADNPDLVRRLVIHSSAHALSDEAKRLQMRVAHLAQQRRWVKASAVMLSPLLPDQGVMKYLSGPIVWFAALLLGLLAAPKDPSDLVVTVEAEDKYDFKDRLGEISAPTLVVAGDRDPFYTEALFRETAEGIPNAGLILYPGKGHPASGKQFGRDVLAFLKGDTAGGGREVAGDLPHDRCDCSQRARPPLRALLAPPARPFERQIASPPNLPAPYTFRIDKPKTRKEKGFGTISGTR